jgi:Tfp pilus assembly protein PilF
MELSMRNQILLAVSALAILGGCATATPPPKFDITPLQRMSQPTPKSAENLLAQGYYAEAVTAFGSLVTSDPGNASAQFGLSEALRKGGRGDDAKIQYLKLAANSDWKLRAIEGVGKTAMSTGDKEGAQTAFEQVVAEDAKAWQSWLGLAQIYDLDHNWAKADEAYAMALASTTQPALIYNNEGLSHLARGEAEWAAEHFKLALSTDPTMKRAATNLEIAESVSGKSLTKVTASERDAKERARKLNNAGYVAMMQNRPAEARAFFQAALEEHPSFYAQAFQNLQTLDAARPKNTVSAQ